MVSRFQERSDGKGEIREMLFPESGGNMVRGVDGEFSEGD